MKATLRGIDYKLSKPSSKRLPKKAGTVALADGNYPVTSNIAWCGGVAEKALEYIWLEDAGTAYYLTLDYGVKASSFAGESIVVSDGTAKRDDPKRVTATDKAAATEAGRILAFKAKVGSKAEAEPVAETETETEEE